MKTVINDVLYDTDKAELLFKYQETSTGLVNQKNHMCLYVSRSGRYFIYDYTADKNHRKRHR